MYRIAAALGFFFVWSLLPPSWVHSSSAHGVTAAVDPSASVTANARNGKDEDKTDEEKKDENSEDKKKAAREAAEKYLKATVTANERLKAAAVYLGEAVRPVFAGKSADVAAYQKAHAEAKKAVAEVDQSFKQLKTPDSDAARAYSAKFQEYLDLQNKFLDEELADMENAISDKEADNAETKKRLIASLKSLDQKDAAVYSALKEAQKIFAKEHGLKIVPPKKKDDDEENHSPP